MKQNISASVFMYEFILIYPNDIYDKHNVDTRYDFNCSFRAIDTTN